MSILETLGLMMKEVDPRIYRILDEKGNTSTFENRVRGFSDIRRFQTNSEKSWTDDKIGQIVKKESQDVFNQEDALSPRG